jgi:hypothetical protein
MVSLVKLGTILRFTEMRLNIAANVRFRVRHDVALMSCFPIEETIRATG